MELDLLGQQIMLALTFRDSGFNTQLDWEDIVAGAKAKSGTIFENRGNRWFMRSDSIPGHLGIKAVAVDEKGLYLETSPLNAERVKEVISELMLPIFFSPEKGIFSDMFTSKPLVIVTKPITPEEEMDKRCLWDIPLEGVSDTRKKVVVRLIDGLYTADVYEVEEAEELTASVTSRRDIPKLSLLLQISLQQRLSLEQRPILSLRQAPRMEDIMTQRLEIRQILALEQRILSMSPKDLEEFVIRYVAEHGEARTKNILLFAIAGRIKDVVPQFTWKEARAISKKLVAVG